MGKDVFNVELEKIKNGEVRNSAEVMLEMLPEYFYKIPASSNRRHPAFSLGEGGLVRHVKVTMRILEEMFRDSAFGTYEDYQKDLMRMALLLQDGLKSGYTNGGYTLPEHPLLMREFVLENKNKLSISSEDTEFVANLILKHMGKWKKERHGLYDSTAPVTSEEQLIHLCDYIASRNFLDVYFKNNEIGDSVDRGKEVKGQAFNRKDAFNVELERIENENVRNSAETMLGMIPDYFYQIPASSSGKYHPIFSLGEGGLARHVKVAMRILEEMFKNSNFGTYENYQKDLMRMALLLHDGLKSGYTNSGHTLVEHPVLMSNFVLDNKKNLSISSEDAEFVANLILKHMGPWNTDKAGNVVYPVPKTREELLVHLCDYIASRNFLNVCFKNNEIADSIDKEKIKTLKREQ